MNRVLRYGFAFATLLSLSFSNGFAATIFSANFGTTVSNTTGVNNSASMLTNAGSTLACTTGDYAYYSTGSNAYFYTNTFHVPRGLGVAISFSVKRPSGTGQVYVYSRVGGASTFNTTNRTRNGWMQLGTQVTPSTSCVTNTAFSIPGNICSGQDVSICFFITAANVSIDNIVITDAGTAASVPNIGSAPYTKTFDEATTSTSFFGPFTATPFSSTSNNIFAFHTYYGLNNASGAITSISSVGGNNGRVNSTTSGYHVSISSNVADASNLPAPSGIPAIITRELNTSTCTAPTATLRFAFKQTYTGGYTFDEDYELYCPRIFYKTTADGSTTGYTWTQATVNYYFPNGQWWYATTSLPKAANILVAFCAGTASGAYLFDDIKVVNNDCSISSKTGEAISCTSHPSITQYDLNTPYTFTIANATTGATKWKWIVRDLTTTGNPFYYGTSAGANPAITSGQTTQTATINFGTTPGKTYRVMCIPYDEDYGTDIAPTDACYAKISIYSSSLTQTPCGLAGIYTIGGSSPDYANFSAAVTDLINCGITDDVIFNVRNGSYSEQITIPAITGSSAANTITFQSESGTRTDVTLTVASGGAPLILDGVSYITFKDMTITNTNATTTGNYAVDIQSTTNNFTLDNCVLSKAAYTNSGIGYSVVNADPGSVLQTDLKVQNCLIQNGSYGVYFDNDNTSSRWTGLEVTGNTFQNQKFRAVYFGVTGAVMMNGNDITSDATDNSFSAIELNDCDGANEVMNNVLDLNITSVFANGIELNDCDGANNVSGNTIEMSGTGTLQYSIYLSASAGKHTITKNRIYSTAGNLNYGLYLTSSASTSGNNSLIANNMIQTTGRTLNNAHAGIYLTTSSHYADIYFNSVNVTASSLPSNTSTSQGALYIDAHSTNGTFNVRNNIFVNQGTAASAFAINLADINDVNTLTNNNYFVSNSGNIIGRRASTDYTDLTWVETAFKNEDPQFTSNTDLHTGNLALDNVGVTVSGVSDDFDGDTRCPGGGCPGSTANPDIGADEFTIAAVAPVADFTADNTTPCIDQTVLFTDISSNTPTSWAWSFSGPGTATYVNSTSASSQDPQVQFSAAGNYTVTLTATNGAGSDGETKTNYITVFAPMAGAYTINSGAATSGTNYNNFTDAVDALICRDINAAVTFTVTSGTYTEQISIPAITGASATNTITFQSQSGNRNDVVLTNASSTGVANNYTLQLAGADYIRFYDMTIARTGTNAYACVVSITGDASNNEFVNNVISGRTGSDATSAALVLSDDNNTGNNNFLFADNHFLNGSAGLWYEGAANNLKSTFTIQNNVFETHRYGLRLQYLEDVTITGNDFTHAADYNTAATQGIYAFYVNNALTISKNTFEFTSATNNEGIELQACIGTAGTIGNISNNMIVVGGTGTIYGINSGSLTEYKNYSYNSVYNTGTNATSSSAYYQNGSDNINLKNNAFFATIGNALEILSPTAGLISSNYNNLYSTGTYVANWGGADQTDLAAWQTASSRDANSISVDPQYLSVTDLHIAGASGMNGAGNPISGITTDIDGDTRNATTPDIGADEAGASCTPGTWTAGAVNIADRTNWFLGPNWTCNTIPTFTLDVTIPANPLGGNYFPELTGAVNGFTQNLTVEPNASLKLTNGAELEVNGTLAYSGDPSIGNGTLLLKGSALSGTFTIGTLTINRSAGITVGASSNVSISNELTLQTGALTVPANASLTLLSSATETAFVNDFGANNGTYSGNITLQRYVPSGVVNSFHYIGSASGGTAAMWSDDFGNSANASDGTKVTPKPNCDPLALAQGSAYGSLFSYDESLVTDCYLDGWRVRTTGASAARGNGFAASIGAGTVLDETGAYNKSNVTISGLSISSTNNVAYSKGYHLVANPFFAPVDWNAMAALGANSNVDGTAYIYNPNSGTYGTYNQITAGEITTNMAFFVRGLSGSSFNVTFDAATRTTTGNADFLRQGQPYQYGLKIKADNGSFSDETLIAFDAAFSDNYDNGFDAAKLLSSYGIPSLYTRDAQSERRAIEALGVNTEIKSVPLGILVPGASGNYTFTFEGIADFPQTTIVWMEDMQTGVIQYLRQHNTYSFTANEQDNPDRFVVHFAPELLITTTGSDCSGNNAMIALEQRGGIEWSFRLKDENNAVIASDVFNTTEVVNQLAQGNYTIELTHPASGYATTVAVTVGGVQPVSAAISASENAAFENEVLTFTAQTTGATTFTFDMGDGTIYTNVQSVNHAYAAAGDYTVSLFAGNDDCNATSTTRITVSKQDVSTGIGSVDEGTITLYESGNVLYLSQAVSKENPTAQFTLFNALGQQVFTRDFKEMAFKAAYTVPVSGIAPGMYFATVQLQSGASITRKVMLGE